MLRKFPLLVAALCLADAPAGAAPGFQEINSAFGIRIFADNNLWDDAPDAIADRLSLPEESTTRQSASYRLYPPAAARVLGIRPYSVALTASEARPTQLSFVFTNSGDFGNLSQIKDNLETAVGKQRTDLKKQEREAEMAFPAALKNDVATLTTTLTKIFGTPEAAREGTSRSVSEKTQRWTWEGHAIQLATKDNQYVALRILPAAVASDAKPLKDAALRERMKGSVQRRPNGDVVISGIPMVDQGPKGFCVAATFDRCLKFVGIPSDMYVLAVAGDSGMGGGASPTRMMDATADLARAFGCRFEKAGASVKIPNVSRYIDAGMPIIWRMHVVDTLDRSVTARSAQRRTTSDVKAWKTVLKQWKKEAGRIKPDPKSGHVCMIIGYNKETEELAVSDSWGPEYAERWISVEEAEAISKGELFTVSW